MTHDFSFKYTCERAESSQFNRHLYAYVQVLVLTMGLSQAVPTATKEGYERHKITYLNTMGCCSREVSTLKSYLIKACLQF